MGWGAPGHLLVALLLAPSRRGARRRRGAIASAFAAVLVVVVACWPMTSVWAGTCGDGNVDTGEDCDPGPDVPGDCCSATCQFDPTGTPCEADGNLCTTDQCD